jgi:hypothetical protein
MLAHSAGALLNKIIPSKNNIKNEIIETQAVFP